MYVWVGVCVCGVGGWVLERERERERETDRERDRQRERERERERETDARVRKAGNISTVFLSVHTQAVFHVEYVDHHSQGSSKRQSVCHNRHRPSGFTTLIKDWDLTAWRLTC